MGWPSSWVVGGLTGTVALLLAGYLAYLIADWYQLSSFEGASGYFMVAVALGGFLVGVVIGVVVSRLVAGGASPGFLRALGIAEGVTVAIILAVGITARLLAHVAPTLDGETMRIAVEVSWPEGSAPSVRPDSGEWRLRLSASIRRTLRASTHGPLWREDARIEGGRWIVPGAVDLFTERGDRVLDLLPEGLVPTGFQLPIPARPGEDLLSWSEWLPRAQEGRPPLVDGVRYRFKVVPSSVPLRTEVAGEFAIVHYVSGFGEVQYGARAPTYTADAHFAIALRGSALAFPPTSDAEGRPPTAADRVDHVAVIDVAGTALMVQVANAEARERCFLVVDEGAGRGQRVETVDSCGGAMRPLLVTSDPAAFAAGGELPVLPGRVDRHSFATPGHYLLGDQALDSRHLTLRPLVGYDTSRVIGRIAPIGISPDGLSFVRIAWGEDSYEEFALSVHRVDNGEQYFLPVDRDGMRVAEIDLIDPTLVSHYFSWHSGPDGADRLAPRANVTPLPYRGRLSQTGSYREYRLVPAREELRDALLKFVMDEFGGTRLPATAGAYAHDLRVGDRTISVAYDAGDQHVGLWMDGNGDTDLVATIAARFDTALKTGRYDGLFGR